ncbi:amino acid adenylation domain-containing protein, partial [Paraburkholderia sediminicola]|uniref:amino acid adenylation domain-containing protein n=1 Tax=Paraburkholderia sediminicola TaxID=458836 RepID=UPI0038B70C9D
GGAGLARGYLGRAGLSAERFVPDPWGTDGARLYRSGDLARREADGGIVYIGRNDAQVKIRGFRIELGEIEAALAALPAVREVRVLAHEGRRLVAYVVPQGKTGCDAAQLEQSLAQALPAHMVPGAYVLLDALPLTHNGKLDRAALPAPDATPADEHVEPATPTEALLAQIWCDVLGVERVGVQDDFFRLGGDSILSLQVVARAQEAHLDITPRQLFEHPTVAGLAVVAEAQRNQPRSRTAIEHHDAMPLTPIQSWFFELHPRGESHWNQSVLLTSDVALDVRALQSAWRHLQKRHDALRLRFARHAIDSIDSPDAHSSGAAGGWQQRVLPFDGGSAIECIDLRALPDAAARLDHACEAAQRSLDIEHGPVCHLLHAKMDDGERVLIVVHHLCVDGVSWRILLRELERDYAVAVADKNAAGDAHVDTIAAASTPWSAWVAAQREHAASDAVVPDASSWRAALAGADPWLPVSCEACATATFGASRTREVRFDADATRRLSSHAARAYRLRVDELLLTALAQTLSAWRARSGVLIDVESHGRTHPVGELDLSATIGWFTTRYPLWIDARDNPTDALLHVKDRVRDVRFDGIHWMWLTQADTACASHGAGTLADLPRAQVSFNYLGRFDTSLEQGGQFRFAAEAGGAPLAARSPLPYVIDVNGLIANEGLSLTWRYSPDVIDDATIARLAGDFEARVLRLIEHCETMPAVPTRHDFDLAPFTRAQFDEVAAHLPDDVADLYPATPLQQGILYHSLIDEAQQSYTNQLHLTLTGALDVAALQNAWQQAVARHDILRTQFFWQYDGAPLQVVRRALQLPFERVALGAQDLDTHALRLSQWRAVDQQKGFSFDAAPLMRVTLFERPDGAHDLIWTHHHLLMDGWSSAQLLSEIAQTYRALTHAEDDAGKPPASAPRFRDYVRWLQAQPGSEAWWREQLARRDEPATLQSGLGRTAAPQPGVAQRRFALDARQSALLQQASRTLGVTLNTITQGAWALLLTRYGNRQQAAFGVTVSGRPAALRGSQQMLGLFIHSLPLCIDARPDAHVSDWLRAIQAYNVALRQHEHTPLAHIQQWAGQGGESLFDSLLVFENYPIDEAARDQRGALDIVATESVDPTHYPLTLSILPREGIEIEWSWNTALFDASTIERVSGHYVELLEQMCALGERRLCELSMGAGAGAASAVQRVSYTYDPTVMRFESRARDCGEAQAVVCGDERLSYAQLDAWADRLGVALMRAGVAHEERVGVCLERSAGLAAALLGIWKAGAAQVPLDPSYPEARLREMIEDAGVRCVIVDAASAARLSEVLEGCVQVRIGDEAGQPDEHAWLAALHGLRKRTASIHPEQLAYVIYTSGSTGRPKGVAVSQRALSLHLDDFVGTYGISARDTLLQSSTINFDVALHELLPALLMGGRVCMRGAAAWDLQALSGALATHQVTFARIPTALWQQWLSEAPSREALPALRQITVGGEGLPGDALARWQRSALAGVRLDNLYGPTETTVAALYRRTQAEDTQHVSAPIGIAYPGRSVCVLDGYGNEVPVGGLGELCIGGVSLARGYLGRPGLTAERFVPSPYNDGERLYRSGDLCRLRADGCIEYLGRLDQQVKLRGYRIELGEIEVQLRGCAGVEQAVVVLRGEGERRRLVAYWVGEAQASQLQAALQSRLPGYMVPGGWMKLARLPVMANGKLDRGALPAPQEDEAWQAVAPRTARETQMRAIWASVLGREAQLGVTQNFFEAGGDSIVSLQLIAKARQAGLKLTPKQVFDHPTIEAQARVAVELGGGGAEQAGQAEIHDVVPLTPIQGSFFERFVEAPSHWNQAVLLRVRGGLEVALLERAVQALVAQHDALRLRFMWADDTEHAGAEEQGAAQEQRAADARDTAKEPAVTRAQDAAETPTRGWAQRQTRQQEPLVGQIAVEDSEIETRVWTQRVEPLQIQQQEPLVDQIAIGDGPNWEQALHDACTRVQRQLDLRRGPLLKAAYLDLGQHGQRVLLAIHHLAVDGVSWRILLEELQQAYAQAERGEAIALGTRSTPFSVWSMRQHEYGMQAERLAELGWWQQRLTGVVAWPAVDAQAKAGLRSKSTSESTGTSTRESTAKSMNESMNESTGTPTATHTIRLDPQTTSALLYNGAHGTGRTALTPEVLLLAALTRTLAQRSAQPRVLVELEGHGREDIFDDIDLTRTVGWFTTRYPVVLEALGDATHTLHTVRTALGEVPQRGLHWGLLQARASRDATVREALAGLPQATVGFNYLGQFDASLPESARFAFAEERGGDSVQTGLHDAQAKALQLDALVADGALQVSWRYRTDQLTQPDVEACATNFTQQLHDMIDAAQRPATRLYASDFPLAHLSQPALDALKLDPESVVDIYPATQAQQGLLLHTQLGARSGIYVNQLRLTLRGPLDVAALRDAWRIAAARHEILRTAFVVSPEADMLQVVQREVEVPFAEHDWSSLDPVTYDDELAAWREADVARGFDIEAPPLMRIALIRRPDGAHDLIRTHHHALVDGWSGARLLGEIVDEYRARLQGSPSARSAPTRYRNYLEWLASADRESESHAWWQQRIALLDEPALLTASLGAPGFAADEQPAADLISTRDMAFDADLSERLRATAQRYHVTLNTLMQGAWAMLLSRYGNRGQAAFGVTVAGRPVDLAGAQDMLGLFINTLPVWTDVPDGARLSAWLAGLQQINSAMREHEQTPLAQVQRWSARTGDALFDSLLVFENYPVDEALSSSDDLFTIDVLDSIERTHYPLTLTIVPRGTITLHWAWRAARFAPANVAAVARHFVDLLTRFTEPADPLLASIALAPVNVVAVSPAREVLDTASFTPVHRRIADHASGAAAARTAVVSGDATLSFGQLNAWSNRIAQRLRRLGVKDDTCVAVCVDRSVGLAAALLGTLKSGAAYVPLDASYPAARLAAMLDDAQVSVVVADAACAQMHATLFADRVLVRIDEVDDERDAPLPDAAASFDENRLAYVIHTSGSTGRPKGVAVTHDALARLLSSIGERPGLSADDTLVSVTTVSFDIFALELYAPLMAGATVVIAPRAVVTDGRRLAALLDDSGATIMQATPMGWRVLLEGGWRGAQGRRFVALCGGEALAPDLAAQLLSRGVELWNMYGPTETTIWSSVAHIVSAASPITLGEAVGHTVLRVVDRAGRCVPVGGVGELCIGGANLARGYVGQAGLSAERFVPDALGEPGARLYRTGDLARVRIDGGIDYLGRLDQQIKFRGYRIEIGEIEAQLARSAGVRHAAVALAGEGEAQRLVAFVVSDNPFDAVRVRHELGQVLPVHMTPSAIEQIDAMPLTSNGKLDRKVLRTMANGVGTQAASTHAAPPSTETEKTLCGLWARALNVVDVGIDDDFFELGGHSLLAVRMVSAMAAAFGRPVDVAQLFRLATIRRIALALDEETGRAACAEEDDSADQLKDLLSMLDD